MRSTLEQFKRSQDNLHEVFPYQPDPPTASEFPVAPCTHRLNKRRGRAVQVKMSKLQPKEIYQAPQFPTREMFFPGLLSSSQQITTCISIIAFLVTKGCPGQTDL